MKNFRETLKEQLKNPKFKKEFDDLEPEYQNIREKIKAGDAICQGIFINYLVTNDDNTDGIRNGGFGSTTKK